jgi:sugar O-acyltransferase (sialic acid O-acetyltransferase NeuD family)
MMKPNQSILRKVIIYGNRALARMLWVDAQDHPDVEIAGFVVDEGFQSESKMFCGLPQVVLSEMIERFPPDTYHLLVLDGRQALDSREPLFKRVEHLGYPFINYISPSAVVASDLVMGVNNVVMDLAYVGPQVVFKDNVIVHQQVYLGHDATIDSHSNFNPGVRIGGYCTCGEGVFVGIGAVIIDHITLGAHSIVGAGALVLKNTEAYTTNVGHPARAIKGARHAE